MSHYRYLIIGGGMTADAAVKGIRKADATGGIGLIGAERDAPYNRPPLTKGLWKDTSFESIWRGTKDHKVDMHLGRMVEALDVQRKQVTDDQGNTYTFDKLLLATGGRPRQLPFREDGIIYYRTVEDYRRLRALTEKARRIAVIGAGFIGSEIAASLAMNKKEVVMIFPGRSIGSKMFPQDLSEFLNKYYQQKGVEVLAGESISGVERRGERFVLRTKSGREVEADGVVAGIGIEPNVELARMAGLRVEDGIVVDEFLQTSRPDIYAAGDVAAFHNPALGKRIRVEHEDNANTMGERVGRNMAGEAQPYTHLPFFYSDLFDLGYEAVGEVDARLQTVADWKDQYREGVVYYLKEGHVRGALLWNVWGQVDAARHLISEGKEFRPEQLKEELLKAA